MRKVAAMRGCQHGAGTRPERIKLTASVVPQYSILEGLAVLDTGQLHGANTA